MAPLDPEWFRSPASSVPDRAPGRSGPLIQREMDVVETDEGPGRETEARESPAGEAPAPLPVPGVQNVFNVTVHVEGGESSDEEALVERLTRVLIDQARRQGIDV